MRSLILNSTKWVVKRSKFVKINKLTNSQLFERYLDKLKIKHPEQEKVSPPLMGKELAEWVFVVEILNHCFWPDLNEARWEVNYGGRWYSGYWALEASLTRALKVLGIRVFDSEFLRRVKLDDLERIFSGKGKIPLIGERLKNLREAGEVLQERWQGSVINVLEEAEKSAWKLVKLLRENFRSFRDEAVYEGKKVYFYKRAQIFPVDLSIKFNGTSWGEWYDLNSLTAFADYKLPQVLRQLGILEYDKKLARKVDNFELIGAGSNEEVEIRAATIQACEMIKEEVLEKKGIKLSSPQIDQWLWSLGQHDYFRQRPYHRTRTIFY